MSTALSGTGTTGSSFYLGTNPSPQAFAKYAKKQDIFLHPDVAFLVPTKTMGMGVFAARPLPAGTVVISCPEASGVSPYMKDAATSPCVAALHARAAAMDDAALFDVLMLMAELCRAASLWRPWLEACPRMEQHFFDLTPAQAAALGTLPTPASSSSLESPAVAAESPAVAAVTGIAQALADLRVAERWAAAEAIMAAHPDVWPAEKATYALYCEALSQVFSRNFHREELRGREGPYLLPGLDILNHSFTANTTFEVRGGGRKHATAFTVVTTRAVQKGEQVYGCYGRIGAARFAVEFQFATKAVLGNDLVRCSAASPPPPATRRSSAQTPANKPADASAALHANGARLESGTVAAHRKEMARRVERLQRLGLLYDEGLYLVRPYATWAAEEAAEPAPSFRWSTPAEHAKEVAQHRRVLAATVHLLTASKDVFDDLYHRITVEWEPPQSPTLTAAVRGFLNVKLAAAQQQRDAASTVFEDSSVRRQLLQDVLDSEMATLRYYANSFA